jgi:hypothetical protein
MGIFSAVNSLIQGGKQKRMAKRINPVQATYEESQPIQDLYAEGKNLYQDRMVGANVAEQNLLTQGANFNAAVDRSATSGSQALAAKAAGLGSTNQAVRDLALKEAEDKQQRFGIFSNVSQLMAQEGDKAYQDKLRKYYDDLNYKRALEGASMQNKANFWSGIDDTVNSAVSLFVPGAGLLAGKGGGSSMAASPASDLGGGGAGANWQTKAANNFPRRYS